MKQQFLLSVFAFGALLASAQQKAKPEDTEQWQPVPRVVTPGTTTDAMPSDAIVLFNGSNLNQWVLSRDTAKTAEWTVADGMFTVKKGTGNIQTKQSFLDYQLHIEWRIPFDIDGSGQGRGNSGLFLAGWGRGDEGYELQILDSYKNETYVNGMAGSIYKQHPPLVNANRAPGNWNVYDVIWTAPRFNADNSQQSPARITVFFNGVLIQNNIVLQGPTQYIGKASYQKAHGATPIKLQDHGDPSKPISFRNIWIRPL